GIITPFFLCFFLVTSHTAQPPSCGSTCSSRLVSYDSHLHMSHSGNLLHLAMTHFPWLSYNSHLAMYSHQHYESLGLCILACFQGLCSLPLHFRSQILYLPWLGPQV